MVDRLLPAPEPNLKSIASVLARSMIEDIVSSTELMKQAVHCGFCSMPTLNQTGELKAIFWWTIRWVSSALKVGQVGVGREVALGLRPGRDRVDDAVDQLADGGLALGRAEVAAEVLADHDVGGELAPEVGDLDVLLLEDALARFVGDAGGAVLPGDLVVGVDPRGRPAALEGQAAGALAGEAGTVRARERRRFVAVAVAGPSALASLAGLLALEGRGSWTWAASPVTAISSALLHADRAGGGSCHRIRVVGVPRVLGAAVPDGG